MCPSVQRGHALHLKPTPKAKPYNLNPDPSTHSDRAAGKRIAQLLNEQGPWLDPTNFFFDERGRREVAAAAVGGSADASHGVGEDAEGRSHGGGVGGVSEGDSDGGGEEGLARGAGEADASSGAEGGAHAGLTRSLSPGSKLLEESRAKCAACIRDLRRGARGAGSAESSHTATPLLASGRGRGTARWQEGVARVNCIDCLDRTNVVQAAICLRVFVEQLRSLGELDGTEYEACQFATRAGHNIPLPAAESSFKHLWSNNGDALSRQYAGTGALKGDFTRKGKRTMGGILADLGSNVKRAVQNNFADVYRQRVIDLMHSQDTERRDSAQQPEIVDGAIDPYLAGDGAGAGNGGSAEADGADDGSSECTYG